MIFKLVAQKGVQDLRTPSCVKADAAAEHLSAQPLWNCLLGLLRSRQETCRLSNTCQRHHKLPELPNAAGQATKGRMSRAVCYHTCGHDLRRRLRIHAGLRARCAARIHAVHGLRLSAYGVGALRDALPN